MASSVSLRPSLLSFILLSLTSFALSQGGERPYYYGNSGSNTHQSSRPSLGYGGAPSRDGTRYPNTGVSPNSHLWGSEDAYSQQSRFGDYEEPSRGNGGFGTEPHRGIGVGPQCTRKVFVSSDQIIDIQTSVQYGAQLLDGKYAHDFEDCVALCCQYTGCDLALYKTDGVSLTGKSCYFVHCGLPEHCRMVSNNGFEAGFLFNEPDYGNILDSHSETPNENHTPQYPGPQDQGTTTPDSQPATTQPATTEQPSTTEAVTTSQPLTTASTTEAVSTAETSSPATQKTADEPKTEADTHTDHPDSTPTDAIPNSILQDGNKTEPGTEAPVVTKATEKVESGTKSSAGTATTNASPTSSAGTDSVSSEPDSGTGSKKGGASTSDSGTSSKQDAKAEAGGNPDDQDANKKSSKDDCGKNGCDGSGLIAVTVVGSLIIVMLLTVAAVVGRRIYKIKRRKQYRNVDYLINGMYT